MLNETDMRSLCIPYPAGGWDADSDNDTAGDIIAPSRAAAIMASTTSQGTLPPPFHRVHTLLLCASRAPWEVKTPATNVPTQRQGWSNCVFWPGLHVQVTRSL